MRQVRQSLLPGPALLPGYLWQEYGLTPVLAQNHPLLADLKLVVGVDVPRLGQNAYSRSRSSSGRTGMNRRSLRAALKPFSKTAS